MGHYFCLFFLHKYQNVIHVPLILLKLIQELKLDLNKRFNLHLKIKLLVYSNSMGLSLEGGY